MAVRVRVTPRAAADVSLAPDRSKPWSAAGGFPHVADAVVAVPGQVLIEADRDREGGLSFIRGHGTYQVDDSAAGRQALASMETGHDDGEDAEEEGGGGGGGGGGTVRLCACNAGIIERVNKLVTVRPPKTRYQGAIGDLVVGRITEVGAKRWKVDVRGNKDAVLQLSAVILPDGLQRIRGHEDQLQMRSFYQERDLISAEVQNVHGDGSIHLHTRTVRYGKLENGLLVYVRPSLIKRSKHHFLTLPGTGLDVILGNNGYVWISRSLAAKGEERQEEQDELQMGKAEVLLAQKQRHASRPTSSEDRLKMARVRNCLLLLDQAFLSISGDSLQVTYHLTEQLGIHPKDILAPITARLILHHLLSGGGEGEREDGTRMQV